MTILPKKKEKQESDSDDGNTSHCALSHGGAAAHGTPHRSSDGEESFAHDTDAYYHRYGAHMSNRTPIDSHGHYDSCDDDGDDGENSSGFAVAKRGYHPPPTSVTPARTKRTEGGSPYSKRAEGEAPTQRGQRGEAPLLAATTALRSMMHREGQILRWVGLRVGVFRRMERNFEVCLKKRGFTLKRMREDGACLFRAVADQVYGDQEMHSVVRNHCLDYMMKNADYFSQFITEDFEGYIKRKRADHCFGNNLEMQAMAEMYNRVIELYQYGPGFSVTGFLEADHSSEVLCGVLRMESVVCSVLSQWCAPNGVSGVLRIESVADIRSGVLCIPEPINIFFGVYKTDNAPIRLSYHGGIHYNSVVDPHTATIGVGLGLAGHKPGLADKTLINGALRESENVFLEQAMLEDKLRTTDWEATYEAVEDAVARESYLQWLKDCEKRPSSSKSGVQTCSLPYPSCVRVRPWPGFQYRHGSSHHLRPSSPTSSMTTPTLLAHPPPIITTTTRGPTSEDAKHRVPSKGEELVPVPIPRHVPALPPDHTTTLTRLPPLPSPLGSPCEVRRRGGSLRGSLRNSPNNSPGGSRNGSPSSARHCGPALELPSGDGGSRKSPPSSPQCPLPEACNDIVQSLPAQQEEVMSSRQQTTPLRTPDFESGAVLDKLPFEYSSFLDASTSAFGLQEWDDDRILAAVLAASQQEYIDSLKHNARTLDRGTDGL
eukprot:Em0001g1252a